jgi:hypothetical protein
MNAPEMQTSVEPVGRMEPKADRAGSGAGRFIVLVPPDDSADLVLARRVWELAASRRTAVVYIGLAGDTSNELALRRRLPTLAGLTRDSRVPVDYHVQAGRDWIRTVRDHWRAGDVVACLSGHRARPGGELLSDVLSRAYPTSVWILTGLPEAEESAPVGGRLRGLAYALSLVAVIALFLVAQARIEVDTQGWVRSALLSASVVVELALLWGLQSVAG